MAVREQGVLVQHSPLGHPAPFAVGGSVVTLPDLPPADRIKRVLIYTTKDILWNDIGDVSEAGMVLPAKTFLVYDSTGAYDMQLVAANAADPATVRVAYYGI